MDRTIYLNDRKYRICDIGEGRCTFVIGYCRGVESLHDCFLNKPVIQERCIFIDISCSWGSEFESLSDIDSQTVTDDIHLLADIYWLDSFEISINNK